MTENQEDWLTRAAVVVMILIAFAVAVFIGGCSPVAHHDAAWRQDDSYGTGQRGMRPDGGAGTVYQRDTTRSPTTPN